MSTLVRPNQTPVERCRYVADLIEAHPENFNMEWFAQDADGSFGTERALYAGERPAITECGTTCCIAGWAVVVTPQDEAAVAGIHGTRSVETLWIAEAARVLLGLRSEAIFYCPDLAPADAAFLLRWHADELDRA